MSTRSFWGWGHAERFPDAAARAALGQQVGAVLGFEPQPPESPAEISAIALPPAAVVPWECADFVSTDAEARIQHTYGKAYRDQVRGFRGDFAAAPAAVATPRDEDDVQRVFEWAARAAQSIVPFGGGTSVVGGVEHPGALSLDLSALSGVREVDDVSGLARIGAGTFGPDLERGLEPHGLTLRHYPQSFEFSTLGGWLATRAGGHFATVYTHIDDLTASIRMLSPAGVFESRRLPGSGAGPSPDRLVLGSEGALGVITEAWMRVRPRPRWRASATAHFATFEQAVAAARAVARSGLFPSNCRLLDKREAALNGVADTPVLLLGFESADHPLDAWMARAVELVRDHGGDVRRPPTLRDDAEKGRDAAADQWRQAFLDGPYLQSTLISLGILADTFETAVTWSGFPALHEALVRDVRDAMKRVCGAGVLTCRFTHVYPDGPAPYYTFVAPARRGAELEQWAAIKAAASDALLAHGATITPHHAVGRTHAPWYEQQRPAPFGDVLAAVKRTLDPDGLLNPGVLGLG